ncbi:MAG: hypothetical protein V1494_05155 [Candidatus Diapherotrites archaeon]
MNKILVISIIFTILLSGCTYVSNQPVDQEFILNSSELNSIGISFYNSPTVKKEGLLLLDEKEVYKISINFKDDSKKLEYFIESDIDESVAKTAHEQYKSAVEQFPNIILEKNSFGDGSITVLAPDDKNSSEYEWIVSQVRKDNKIIMLFVFPKDKIDFEKTKKIIKILIEKVEGK